MSKRNRVGVLVHPFWYTLELDKSLEEYRNYISEYDKVIIFLPMLNKYSREHLFNTFYEVLIDFLLLTKEELEFMINTSTIFGMISNCLQEGLTKTHLGKLISYRKELCKLRKRKVDLVELKLELLNDKQNVLKYLNATHKKITFYGDLSFIPVINQYTSKLLSSVDNVGVYYFGGVQTIDYMLHREQCKKLIEMLRDSNVEIFGEYYNVCVSSTKKILNDLGIRSRMIRSKSIYLNNKNKDIASSLYMNIYTPGLMYNI